jgi:dTDP-4-amino-4,6-dideoxygalactose transaminase
MSRVNQPKPNDAVPQAIEPVRGETAHVLQGIPVMRPQLPSADKLLPYLRRIDNSRTYSNWGPLVTELGTRLGAQFGLHSASVVCANSGMSALVAAILATSGRATAKRPLAIVPEYTFTASALSVQACGFEPVLASCDADTWTFSPESLLTHPELLAHVGVVMPVSPYGRLVPHAQWLKFQHQTGIPVVIDGAACFELLAEQRADCAGPLPLALSFHATKSFGTGEGGAVLTTDAALGERILQCLNFGFLNGRLTQLPSINGKMSEYTAAIGLAELDGWAFKTTTASKIFPAYERAFARRGIRNRIWGSPDISSCYVLLQCDSSEQATRLIEAMDHGRIGTRQWYGRGLGEHGVFEAAQRLDLHADSALDAQTLVGLPVAPDLTEAQIERIAGVAPQVLR